MSKPTNKQIQKQTPPKQKQNQYLTISRLKSHITTKKTLKTNYDNNIIINFT